MISTVVCWVPSSCEGLNMFVEYGDSFADGTSFASKYAFQLLEIGGDCFVFRFEILESSIS